MPLVNMTRERANAILDLWRDGIEAFPDRIIAMALYVTGDLERLH